MKIILHLQYEVSQSSSGAASHQQGPSANVPQHRNIILTEEKYTAERPLIIQVGEKFMIEARNMKGSEESTRRAQSRQTQEPPPLEFDCLYLTIIEFDSDCAIRVLHPPSGAQAQPLRPLGRVCIGSLSGTGTVLIQLLKTDSELNNKVFILFCFSTHTVVLHCTLRLMYEYVTTAHTYCIY